MVGKWYLLFVHPLPQVATARRRRRSENIGSFRGLETGWLARQFPGNRLAGARWSGGMSVRGGPGASGALGPLSSTS